MRLCAAPTALGLTLLLSEPEPVESSAATLINTSDDVHWEAVAESSAALFDNSTLAGVTEGGEGLLAFGSSPGGQAVPTAAIFTTRDGIDWQRVTPRTADFEGMLIRDVVEIDGGYVAVGGDFSTGLMTAWTSPYGLEWTRSPHPADVVDPSTAVWPPNSTRLNAQHQLFHSESVTIESPVDPSESEDVVPLPSPTPAGTPFVPFVPTPPPPPADALIDPGTCTGLIRVAVPVGWLTNQTGNFPPCAVYMPAALTPEAIVGETPNGPSHLELPAMSGEELAAVPVLLEVIIVDPEASFAPDPNTAIFNHVRRLVGVGTGTGIPLDPDIPLRERGSDQLGVQELLLGTSTWIAVTPAALAPTADNPDAVGGRTTYYWAQDGFVVVIAATDVGEKFVFSDTDTAARSIAASIESVPG